MKPFLIRVAEGPDQLAAIYKFRYSIYVDEMGRKQDYADPVTRTIEDPLDSGAINLAAWVGTEIVGVIRNNAAADGSLGLYEEFYRMRDVGADHPTRTSITTRLMLAPAYRRGTLAVRLAEASFVIGLERNVRWNFIDCNPPLVGFFKGLGWIEHIPPGEHPEYGMVHRMRLDLMDSGHLITCGSPFTRQLKSFGETGVEVAPA